MGNGEYNRIYKKWMGQYSAPLFTQDQVVLYVATILALGLIASLLGLFRQRSLRKRLVRQAAQLAEQRALLQALYDNIPMAMTVIEVKASGARLVSMNRQACTLYAIDPSARGGPRIGRPSPIQ